MPNQLTRSDIKEILAAWQSGEMNKEDVQNWAEDRYAFEEQWIVDDNVVQEVLEQLAHLNMNLIVSDDIPAFIQVLEIPSDLESLGLETLKRHHKSINYQRRRKQLRADPFYQPFC